VIDRAAATIERVRAFDRKFGADFLAAVPSEPGVYRFYDPAGTLLYVGKARNLRRRLAQYRATRRTKRDRKRRALVETAARVAWEVCPSELDAALTEIELIQTFRPPRNVATAYSFLYPFIGLRVEARESEFCLTTSPEAFSGFELHGAFRSRAVTREAFFALMRLLRLVGHSTDRSRPHRLRTTRHAHVLRFRRLPAAWPDLWREFLRGTSRDALVELCLRLLDHPAARARGAIIQEDLRAIGRFFEEEISPLTAAIAATGYASYPVAQRDRDLLFVRYRDRVKRPASRATSDGATASPA
jgi:excinuclease ABC subunit C